MISVEIDAPKIPKQLQRLQAFPRVQKNEFRRAAAESVVKMVSDWKEVAPVDRGRYRGSIAGKVLQISGEVAAMASTNVSERGFPYPAALEQSERYHYRRGPRRGRMTKDHASKAFKRGKRAFERFFNRAVERIIRKLQV